MATNKRSQPGSTDLVQRLQLIISRASQLESLINQVKKWCRANRLSFKKAKSGKNSSKWTKELDTDHLTQTKTSINAKLVNSECVIIY